MKRTLLFVLALVLAGLTTKAQYFQHTYGPSSTNWWGQNITALSSTNPGYVMSGRYCHVVHTDLDGNIPSTPPNYFNNFYQLSSSGKQQTSFNDCVFELNNGTGFGVIGWLSPRNTVYYLKLNPDGSTSSAYEYVPPTDYVVESIRSIEESSTGNEVYVTGWAQDINNSPLYVGSFILKINVTTGALIWSSFYKVSTASGPDGSADYIMDMVESPFNGNLVAVGVAEDYTPGAQNSFVIQINPSTGALAAYVFYGSGELLLSSIAVSNSTYFGSKGFVMSGAYKSGGETSIALIKTTFSGVIQSGKRYKYSFDPTSDQSGIDVVVRYNPTILGDYEYYIAGNTSKGVFGNSDIVVIKTDEGLNGIGEYTYGTSETEEVRHLELNNSAPNEGLSIFGTQSTSTGTMEKYFVRAYLNGVTACNDSIGTPSDSTISPGTSTPPHNTFESFTTASLSVGSSTGTDNQICYAQMVTGGDNSLVAPPKKDDGSLDAIVTPNPIWAGTQAITLEVQAESTVNVHIAIYDMLGKQYYNGDFTIEKGKNQLPVDLSAINMAVGMYTVHVSNGEINKNILLMVK